MTGQRIFILTCICFTISAHLIYAFKPPVPKGNRPGSSRTKNKPRSSSTNENVIKQEPKGTQTDSWRRQREVCVKTLPQAPKAVLKRNEKCDPIKQKVKQMIAAYKWYMKEHKKLKESCPAK